MKHIFLFGFICGIVFAFFLSNLLGPSGPFEQPFQSIVRHSQAIVQKFQGINLSSDDDSENLIRDLIEKYSVKRDELSHQFGEENNRSLEDEHEDQQGVGSKSDKSGTELQEYEQDESIYGIKIDDSIDDVKNQLGEPNRIDPSHMGFEWWIYNSDWDNYIQVGIKDGKVATLYTNGMEWLFKDIRLGMDRMDVKERLGEPESRLPIMSGVTIHENSVGERIAYKINGQIVLFYFDRFNEDQVTGIRLFTPRLFSKSALKLGFQVEYFKKEDIYFTQPTESEKTQIEAAYECQIVDLTNIIRMRWGLNYLDANELVADIAKSHSTDMYENQFFDHVSPTTGTLHDRFVNSPLKPGSFGENIAAGYLDGIDAVEGWMNSEGHRKNILNEYGNEIGVGVVLGQNDAYDFYYTQNFYREN